ncbi:four helix bundle protein [Candidatus Peregrinibacteria bacterium]|nr:four helix bundle protein [Candidatus Peregrinibacteria bacterium]
MNLSLRSYQYSISVIKFLNNLPNERNYWVVSDQLLKSATSIGANIAEAKSASSRKDFIKFYEIALKSANETKYWLGLLKDALKISQVEITPLLQEAEELSKILAASLLTMKGRRQF